jgi:hypothetical protein
MMKQPSHGSPMNDLNEFRFPCRVYEITKVDRISEKDHLPTHRRSTQRTVGADRRQVPHVAERLFGRPCAPGAGDRGLRGADEPTKQRPKAH